MRKIQVEPISGVCKQVVRLGTVYVGGYALVRLGSLHSAERHSGPAALREGRGCKRHGAVPMFSWCRFLFSSFEFFDVVGWKRRPACKDLCHKFVSFAFR